MVHSYFSKITVITLTLITMMGGMIGSTIVATISFAHAQTNQSSDDANLVVEADDNLQWLRAERKYIATGNASATRGGTRLDADVIVAD